MLQFAWHLSKDGGGGGRYKLVAFVHVSIWKSGITQVC